MYGKNKEIAMSTLLLRYSTISCLKDSSERSIPKDTQERSIPKDGPEHSIHKDVPECSIPNMVQHVLS